MRHPLACLLLALAGTAAAQSVEDTLRPAFLAGCGADPEAWRTEFGFVFGSTSLGDREKLQRLDLPGPGNGFVTAIGIEPAVLRPGTPSGAVRAVAYAVGPDGRPGSFLRASDTLLVAALAAGGGIRWFPLPEPAPFTDRVFAGIDLRLLQPGDSVGVLGTREGCGSGCVAWERWADGTLNPICDTWNLEDVDFRVYAAVTWTPRVSGGPSAEGRSPAWTLGPVPAAGRLRLARTAPGPAWPWMARAADGRPLGAGTWPAGQTEQWIDTGGWPAGCGVLETGGARRRFCVLP
jgi:hypothetical protein